MRNAELGSGGYRTKIRYGPSVKAGGTKIKIRVCICISGLCVCFVVSALFRRERSVALRCTLGMSGGSEPPEEWREATIDMDSSVFPDSSRGLQPTRESHISELNIPSTAVCCNPADGSPL